MNRFAVLAPDGPLYRLARALDPWAWPDWAYAGLDGTFGNRWDDPLGSYRVLYASTRRVGTFIETLARFRPDLAVVAGLEEIEGELTALGTEQVGHRARHAEREERLVDAVLQRGRRRTRCSRHLARSRATDPRVGQPDRGHCHQGGLPSWHSSSTAAPRQRGVLILGVWSGDVTRL
jgi:hypothetical protein